MIFVYSEEKMGEKTNAMRKLDSMKANYKEHYYVDTDAIAGVDIARVLNEDPARVFKTLVTVGKSSSHYVFLVPVAEELSKVIKFDYADLIR